MTTTVKTYRMPAEWEPQQATLLSWPQNLETWPFQLSKVQSTYIEIIRHIADHQEVWVLVSSDQEACELQRLCVLHSVDYKNLRCFIIPTHDAWIRDYGPVVVYDENRRRHFTDWVFNGWGDKYGSGYHEDSFVPCQLTSQLGEPCVSINHVLEGGSVEVNGSGLLLTTENCLLNANRHHQVSKHMVEALFREYFGAHKVLWLKAQLAGDDTDSHIDNIARFVDPQTVLCSVEDNEADDNYHSLQQAFRSLKSMTDQNGSPLRVLPLPLPDPVYEQGLRLPASYANFLITSQKVLLPVYGCCAKDKQALAVLSECFPNKTVVTVDSRALIYGLGSIHCLSQQVPINF